MSVGNIRDEFLYNLPSNVLWKFCLVMDGLSDLDWTRFASEVLIDQTAVRLAERRERRTDWVMNRWGNRNGRVGELLDVLERLQLYRPRDVVMAWISGMKTSSPPLPPLPVKADPPVPRPDFLDRFDLPPKPSGASPALPTCKLETEGGGGGGAQSLPKPAPPPDNLLSDIRPLPEREVPQAQMLACSGAMFWPYEEVHAGTEGFSPSLQVGEGGFGIVYRATLRNTVCAVKRLKQDSPLDWSLLKDSFKTEVEKLSRFRHPNIVDLLGFTEGGGSFCLIYSYMENKSLEDQLHKDGGALSWWQRVSVVKGASAALQFLHFGNTPVIHGDVKSSNILLDRHLEAKLADFGLAQFVRGPSGRTAVQTTSVRTATVRGTLAYLPDEYVRNGQLGRAVDVYSFGVVLLEVLTGRRALEKDVKRGEMYLKDLVEELQESPSGSSAATWRKHLDRRLVSGGAAEPAGCTEMLALACSCLDAKRKKRPAMKEVFDKLKDIYNAVMGTTGSSSSLQNPPHPAPHYAQSFPRPPCSLDSAVGALAQQMSTVGPLEDTSDHLSTSSSSSSSCCLTPLHPLHSSSTTSSSSVHSSSSSSFAGPCETDESRGFSQYQARSQLSGLSGSQYKSNGTHVKPPSTGDQSHSPIGSTASQFSHPSVPTEDQYNFPPLSSNSGALEAASSAPSAGQLCLNALTASPSRSRSGLLVSDSDTRGQRTAGAAAVNDSIPKCLSPAASLQSSGPSVHVNSSKQRLLRKTTLYEEGQIHTPELLSSDDLYVGSDVLRRSVQTRGPEESDELEYLLPRRT